MSGNNGAKEILFVCYANVYRSQIAEGFFNHYNTNPEYAAVSAGLEQFQLDKATIELMAERGIDISHHRSKRVTEDMIKRAHRIYALSYLVPSAIRDSKVVALYVDDTVTESIEARRETREDIERKVLGILEELHQDVTQTI